MMEGLAIFTAIAAALLLNYAIYLQKKAVGNLPEIKGLSWGVIKAFITNRPWLFAQVSNISGFVLYSVALALAPVSIVEPIVASGVVLLAYLAIKNLGEKPRRIDYFAMALSVGGVALIGISLAEGLPKDELHHPAELWIFAAALLAVAIVIPLLMRGSKAKLSVGLGITVGILFGLAAVFQRLLMMNFGPNMGKHWVNIVVFAIACIVMYLPAFMLLQAALQKGMAIIVAPVYNGLMEFVPIMMGMIVLNEKFPESNVLKVARILAFVFIITGTVILSQRAEADEVESFPGGEIEPIVRPD